MFGLTNLRGLPCFRAGLQLLHELGVIAPDGTPQPMDRSRFADHDDEWWARVSYTLALLVEPYRRPTIDGARLMQLTDDCGLSDLLGLVNGSEVTDLIAMRDLAVEQLLPHCQPGWSLLGRRSKAVPIYLPTPADRDGVVAAAPGWMVSRGHDVARLPSTECRTNGDSTLAGDRPSCPCQRRTGEHQQVAALLRTASPALDASPAMQLSTFISTYLCANVVRRQMVVWSRHRSMSTVDGSTR